MGHRWTITLAAGTALAAAGGASAQTVSGGYGSATVETVRPCETGAAIRCNGINSVTGRPMPVTQSNRVGGAGEAIDTRFAPTGAGAGSSATALVQFGDLGIPTIKMSAAANAVSRIGNSVYTYQTFTYTGEEEFDLLLAANFHIVNSTTDARDGLYPGGAQAYAGFAIWDADDFFAYQSPDWAGDGGFSGPNGLSNQPYLFGAEACEAFADPDYGNLPGGPRATSANGVALAGGANQNLGVTQQNCGEETLTLYSGDQFVVASFAQLFTNRGGSADASGTFRVQLNPSIDPEAARAFAANLQYDTPGAVPEPATWATITLGFGALGAAMRRSRAHRAVTFA